MKALTNENRAVMRPNTLSTVAENAGKNHTARVGSFIRRAHSRLIKITSLTAIIFGLTISSVVPSAMAAEFAGNVALTTDYRFRGISQGDRSPAIQGGFDLATESGFYVGTWASNVTFSGASIELDIYGGFAGDISESTSYDVGVLYYAYPEDDSTELSGTGDRDLDYVELYGSVSFGDATLGLAYSPDYFFETDSFIYLYGDYSYTLAENWSLDLHYGINMFDDEAAGAEFGIGSCNVTLANGNCADGTEDTYSDWSVGVSTSAAGLDFSLQYVDTDLDEADCFGNTKLCDATAVFTISKSL